MAIELLVSVLSEQDFVSLSCIQYWRSQHGAFKQARSLGGRYLCDYIKEALCAITVPLWVIREDRESNKLNAWSLSDVEFFFGLVKLTMSMVDEEPIPI